MNVRFSKSLFAIIIASLIMGAVALPDSAKQNWPSNAFTNFFKDPKITLGLDLQGGTQLDYRVDLRNAYAKNEDNDPDNNVVIKDIVEGVRTTLERRVNGLGVSEPQIYLSNVAGEQHIIVELAGIKDIDEAKGIVGKTIQLEFKEPKTEVDPEEKDKIEAEAKSILAQALEADADFAAIGENVKTVDYKIDYRSGKKQFLSNLTTGFKEVLPTLNPGEVHPGLVEDTTYTIDGSGNLVLQTAIYVVQLVSSEESERTKTESSTFAQVAGELDRTLITLEGKSKSGFDAEEAKAIFATQPGSITEVLEAEGELRVYNILSKEGAKEVKASHILIAYKGSERANPDVKRSKKEAEKEAQRLAGEAADDPDAFGDLAKEFSDGPSGSKGGDLGFFGPNMMAKAFEEAAFGLPVGGVSGVVETEFGFHIIKVTDEKESGETVNVELLSVETDSRSSLEAALANMEPHEVTTVEQEFVYNEIYFDLTPDPWKSTGLDGSHFKYATVIYGQLNDPQVNIFFDSEGGDMFEDITGRLVGRQLAIFVGGQLISAPNVNSKISGGSAVITGDYDYATALQLANDLNTGAIDAPVILSSQYTISATLGDNALRLSLIAGLIGLLLLAAYMILYYRLMGVLAVIALLIYAVIIVFILKMTGIVMTLAGIAGIILSIGMAVDANILIFERTKEELNSGKGYIAAVTTGFERAWSSIRDSNVSSLITCAILWFFGNSIIRGFALMLALGIIISMFTAITVTRKLLQSLAGTRLSKNRFLLGVKEVESINR